MRPVYVRELKELAPAGALLVAAAVVTGMVFIGPLSREFDDILIFPIVGGLGLGCLHGALDRWRRGDLFSLHRPLPAARMEAGRTLAGATVALTGIIALVIAHRLGTGMEIALLRRLNDARIDGFEPPYHLGPREIGLAASFLLAGWAITRFAAGAVRLRWTLPALVALPLAGWSLVARADTTAVATGMALALTLVFSLGSRLCLAEDRR